MPTRYYLACAHEQVRPDELLQQAVAGEAAGFDGVCCSDHFRPFDAIRVHRDRVLPRLREPAASRQRA